MRICLDTNVLARLFSLHPPYPELLRALVAGRLSLLVSNEILLEYEEVIVRQSGVNGWRNVQIFLGLLEKLNCLIRIEPSYRFQVITVDADDNKFVDCAIAGQARMIVTTDRHFGELAGAGYVPAAASPSEILQALRNV